MNVIPMMTEVPSIANPMIRKSPLPHFRFSPDQGAECMRMRALDQLDGALNRHILRGSEHKMYVIGHNNEDVQRVASFATVMIESLEK